MFYIIGKPDCPYCDRAKDLLDRKGTEYTYEELTETSLALLKGMGIKTVPAVFKHIGGFHELKLKVESE